MCTQTAGNNTAAINFSGALFRFNGGPAIVFGGAGGDHSRSNGGIWYESLCYSGTGRPVLRRLATEKLTTKPREQKVAKLAALTQPAA